MNATEKATLFILETLRFVVHALPFWPGSKTREEKMAEIDLLIADLEKVVVPADTTAESDTNA